jgi:hypothetical protein
MILCCGCGASPQNTNPTDQSTSNQTTASSTPTPPSNKPSGPIPSESITALKVNEHSINQCELNYFYFDAINEYCSQYGNWISFILDPSKPLSEQKYNDDKSWADMFLEVAIDNAKSTYALCDAAAAAGHTLSEEENNALKSLSNNIKTYATGYGYKSADEYLAAVYGNGATMSTYEAYYKVVLTASSYYGAHAEALKDSYTTAVLRDYEKGKAYEYHSYSYASHFLEVEDFLTGGTKGSDGKITYSEDEIKAAEAAAKKAAEELAAASNNTIEKLNAAIETLEKKLAANVDTSDENNKEEKYSTAQEQINTLYQSINPVIQEWIRNTSRKNGDIAVLEYVNTSTDPDGKEVKQLNGYYVVLYQGVKDNHFPLANVRHILTSFKDSSAETKKAAKETAEKIYNDWLNGDQSEESFAALAKEKTDDGNGDAGGLYEDIYPGQMVTTFNDWCFDETRKPGDHGIVETEYGYHIMYYSSDSKTTFHDFMIINDKLSDDLTAWQKQVIDSAVLETIDTSCVNLDLVLSGS